MIHNDLHKDPENDLEIDQLVYQLLRQLGEDPHRLGLLKTPSRVSKSLRFLTKGYAENSAEILQSALFPAESDAMVLVKKIQFFSLCEHHLLPFFGQCHIAYLPNKKIVGLSKLPRLVETLSRRLQVQERLTQQIADAIQTHLQPLGVGIIMEAQHLCMMMRGTQQHGSAATTSAMTGCFRSDASTRQEFLNLIPRT